MGADIHLYVEKRLKNKEWAMVRDLNHDINTESLRPWRQMEGQGANVGGWWRLADRNYTLFANLAGVRGMGPEAKGLPGDVSPYVQDDSDRWDGDGHSHSWSTPLEFMEAYVTAMQFYDEQGRELDKYVQARLTEGTEKAVSLFMRDLCSLDTERGEEYRFVYWFDN